MSNLSVGQDLNEIPQAIRDQDSNTSGLFITNAATGVVSIPFNGRFVFGIAPFGIGEWIQNSNGVNGEFGISFFIGHFSEGELVRVLEGFTGFEREPTLIRN